jgi:hypothetical protein
MSHTTRTPARVLAGALALGAAALAACSDATAPASAASAALLGNAFTSATPGYEQLTSSYAADGQTGTWAPERGGPGGRGGRRGGDALGFGGFMGGGVADAFLGGPLGGFGRRGPFGGGLPEGTCAFSSDAGRVTCAAVTRDGLTYQRSAAYATAAGAAQAAFDSLTTNSVTVQTSVSGTATFTPRQRRGFGPGFGRDSAGAGARVASATSEVQSASSRTVTGLAPGSTRRTVNSTSAGRESSAGVTVDSVRFTSVRVMGDTTTGLVVPVRAGGRHGPGVPDGRHGRAVDAGHGHVRGPGAGVVGAARGAHVRRLGHGPARHHARRRDAQLHGGAAARAAELLVGGAARGAPAARGRPR